MLRCSYTLQNVYQLKLRIIEMIKYNAAARRCGKI